MIAKPDLLLSSDYNSLYPSALAHLNLKLPKIETAKAINIEDRDRFFSLFNNSSWKVLQKSEFFKLRYFNPKEIISQHMSVKQISSATV